MRLGGGLVELWCQTQQCACSRCSCLLVGLLLLFVGIFLIEPGKLFEDFWFLGAGLGKDVVRYVSVISLTHSGNTTESLMSGDDVLVACCCYRTHSVWVAFSCMIDDSNKPFG